MSYSLKSPLQNLYIFNFAIQIEIEIKFLNQLRNWSPIIGEGFVFHRLNAYGLSMGPGPFGSSIRPIYILRSKITLNTIKHSLDKIKPCLFSRSYPC